ncbi:MAG: thioredoxin family protein, partial [Planctomycetota bacterium]
IRMPVYHHQKRIFSMSRDRSVFVFLAVFLFCASPAISQTIQWQPDLETAQKVATNENKLILLHFSADWCRPCKQLETFVFNSELVAKTIHSKLVPVMIDTDSNPDLVKKFAIKEIPADVIISPNGRVITKRKSPKNSNNYIRMVQNISLNESTIKSNNAEITQKIDAVLQSANDSVALSGGDFQGGGDFAPPRQEMTKEAKDLFKRADVRDNAINNSQVQPVAAQASESTLLSDIVRQELESPTGNRANTDGFASPVRVINDNFFVEKSRDKNSDVDSKTTVSIQNPFRNQDTEEVISDDKTNLLSPRNSHFQDPEFATAAETASQGLEKSTLIAKDTAASDQFEGVDHDRILFSSETKKQQSTSSSQPNPVDSVEQKIMLGGFCPVSLLRDGEWKKGDEQFGCEHRGRIYLFASKFKMDAFLKSPDALSPILAGYDPVIYHDEGELVDGIQEHGVFVVKLEIRKIVLFSSAETRAQFQSEPEKYMASVQTATKRADREIQLR